MKALVSLNFIKSSDVRKPVTTRIEILSEDTSQTLASVDLSPPQFAQLMSGQMLVLNVDSGANS